MKRAAMVGGLCLSISLACSASAMRVTSRRALPSSLSRAASSSPSVARNVACAASAGATGCGGLLLIDGNASTRCGISARGIDIVVKGSVGHMSAFMAQAGSLVVLGDAGDALGDSLYEARLFVRGKVNSLGADCIEKPLGNAHREMLGKLLEDAGLAGEVDPSEFRRYGSARQLYHFHMDNLGAY